MNLPVLPPLAPMLAKLARELPREAGYFYEPKWDGFRCLVFRDGPGVDLRSRHDSPFAGRPAGVLHAAAVALRLRELLARDGLVPFAKTSGSLGVHVYVPLAATYSFEQTKAFARDTARRLATDDPAHVVDRMTRSIRAGKVLVDWLQNDPSRSTVAAYSLRALPWPTVSTPLEWYELEAAVSDRRPDALFFGPADVLKRLDRGADVFAGAVESSQALPA